MKYVIIQTYLNRKGEEIQCIVGNAKTLEEARKRIEELSSKYEYVIYELTEVK